MQILNSKIDETPRHSNVKKIRISNISKNLSESTSPDPSRYSMISENSKAMVADPAAAFAYKNSQTGARIPLQKLTADLRIIDEVMQQQKEGEGRAGS